jgi:hypothetical protein
MENSLSRRVCFGHHKIFEFDKAERKTNGTGATSQKPKERRRERDHPILFFSFLRPGTSSGTYSISILSFSEGNEFF